MKCSQCGREFTAEELTEQNGVCPQCGCVIKPQSNQENQTAEEPEQTNDLKQERSSETKQADQEKQPQPSPRKNKTVMMIAGVIIGVAVIASAAFLTWGSMQQQKISPEEHINKTALAYVTDEGVGLATGTDTVELYQNNAENEDDRQQISQMLTYSTPYIGHQNYVELENGEIVYLPLNITSPDEMVGQLYVKNSLGEEKVLDEDASILYCHSKNSVYYNKMVDGKLVQMRYKDGEVTPVKDIVGKDNIVVMSASDDDNLLQVLQIDENQTAIAGGYFYNGKLHMLDTKYTIANISKQSNDVFLISNNTETSQIELYRVTDLENEEMELISGSVYEMAFYDNGSMSFLADCDTQSGAYNPVGSVYWYDVNTGKAEKVADNAVSLMESSIRANGWMNENGRDMATSEMAQQIVWDKPLYEGQVHYVDAQGNLCVSSAAAATVGESGMQGMVICEDFYDVDQFTFRSDITFATATEDALYWSRGAELYRYQLGSMEAPQVIPLNESVEEKAQEVTAQVGYLTVGSGDILEETNQTLVLKKFEDESSVTVLENVGNLTLAGVDNDGTHIYFISEDGSLYRKSLEDRSNPKRIDSDVVHATATSEGLYYLVSVEKSQEELTVGESGEESAQPEYQFNLMFLQYGQREAQLVKEDVNSIMAMNVEQ